MVNGAHDERSTGARVYASVVLRPPLRGTYRIDYQEKKWGVRVRTSCAGHPHTEAFACICVRLAPKVSSIKQPLTFMR